MKKTTLFFCLCTLCIGAFSATDTTAGLVEHDPTCGVPYTSVHHFSTTSYNPLTNNVFSATWPASNISKRDITAYINSLNPNPQFFRFDEFTLDKFPMSELLYSAGVRITAGPRDHIGNYVWKSLRKLESSTIYMNPDNTPQANTTMIAQSRMGVDLPNGQKTMLSINNNVPEFKVNYTNTGAKQYGGDSCGGMKLLGAYFEIK